VQAVGACPTKDGLAMNLVAGPIVEFNEEHRIVR
jgi:hypothetical protein